MVIYNISSKDKAWRVKKDDESLFGKSIGESFDGKELMPELDGYELLITGGSDNAGFPLLQNQEGVGLRRVLLKKGWGMRDSREGVRIRKTVRGKILDAKIAQVNIVIVKEGKKPLNEIFPEQNNPKAKEEPKKEVAAPVAAAA